MVARLNGVQKVVSSNLTAPTNFFLVVIFFLILIRKRAVAVDTGRSRVHGEPLPLSSRVDRFFARRSNILGSVALEDLFRPVGFLRVV